ncbi:hypothetical protein OPKNFCMD_5213 [Methylobacterium crusticola]|uniref:HPt domain-containing protein n=1 Tax=Methylobacterium crusticola TaxID=1697972 RepID=A0ABQ4R437_9HYPH|nr:hypothetical protein OPKNFCMD_5213 [Methylobacterium crusticola]
MPAAAPPCLDRPAFEDLRDAVGAAALAVLLGRFAAQLRGWSLAADPPALAAEAHGVVASSGLIGFAPLSRLCAALERACTEGSPEEVRDLAARVADEKERVEAEIARLLAGPGAA